MDDLYLNDFHREWDKKCEEENARVASMRFSNEYLKAQSERMERLCREQSEKERLRRRKKNSSKSGQ